MADKTLNEKIKTLLQKKKIDEKGLLKIVLNLNKNSNYPLYIDYDLIGKLMIEGIIKKNDLENIEIEGVRIDGKGIDAKKYLDNLFEYHMHNEKLIDKKNGEGYVWKLAEIIGDWESYYNTALSNYQIEKAITIGKKLGKKKNEVLDDYYEQLIKHIDIKRDKNSGLLYLEPRFIDILETIHEELTLEEKLERLKWAMRGLKEYKKLKNSLPEILSNLMNSNDSYFSTKIDDIISELFNEYGNRDDNNFFNLMLGFFEWTKKIDYYFYINGIKTFLKYSRGEEKNYIINFILDNVNDFHIYSYKEITNLYREAKRYKEGLKWTMNQFYSNNNSNGKDLIEEAISFLKLMKEEGVLNQKQLKKGITGLKKYYVRKNVDYYPYPSLNIAEEVSEEFSEKIKEKIINTSYYGSFSDKRAIELRIKLALERAEKTGNEKYYRKALELYDKKGDYNNCLKIAELLNDNNLQIKYTLLLNK